MALSGWSYRVGPRTATDPAAQVGDWLGVSMDLNIDNGSSGMILIPAADPSTRQIDELVTDLFTYLDGQLWARHRIVKVDQEWGEDSDDFITCSLLDYQALLNRRKLVAALDFASADQSSIAWDLIDAAQTATGGSLGLTAGTLDPGTPRERHYLAGDNVGQRLRELAQVIDGPRYVFHPTKVVDVLDPDTWPTLTMPLRLGMNVRRLSRPSGADQFANAYFGTGDNAWTTMHIEEDVGLAADPRGRWDAGQAWSTVKEQDTLVEHTEGALQAAVNPMTMYQLVMNADRWFGDSRVMPGTLCTVVQPPSIVAPIVGPQNVPGMVIDVHLTIDASGGTEVTATVAAT